MTACFPRSRGDRIIACAEQSPAPKRLVLGSDSYRFLRAALSERLADVEAQQDTAGHTDFTE